MGTSRLLGSIFAMVAFAGAGAPAGAQGVLRLEVGKRWELASAPARQSMSLEVVGRDGEAYVVRWRNPYVNTTFHFRLDGARVLLDALDMGNGLARMPTGTVYFDLGAKTGAMWKNALGTVAVTDGGKRVAGRSDGTEFELTDPKGARTYWTLSPEGGFLAFGKGAGAFVLTGVTSSPAPSAPSTARPAPSAPDAVRPGPGPTGERLLVGLDSNPPPPEGYDDASRMRRAHMASQAGVNYVYAHPKWTEAEPSAGRYDFAEVDFKTRVAAETNAPLSLNLRMVDTNQRAIPEAYKDWPFGDERMARKLVDVLRAIAPRTKGRVRWIAIGNEADNYFDTRKAEIGDYAQLIRRVLPAVRELFPDAKFTINLTHAAAGALGTTYAPFAELCDFISFTYYPVNADFSMQDPGNAAGDIARMVRAAGDKRVLFQEIGYASSPEVGSSQERQAQFMGNVFQALRAHRGRVLVANFVWMSDLPQSVVDDLGRYYGMADVGKFKAFIGSLGYWTRDGVPKIAWGVFQREASLAGMEARTMSGGGS